MRQEEICAKIVDVKKCAGSGHFEKNVPNDGSDTGGGDAAALFCVGKGGLWRGKRRVKDLYRRLYADNEPLPERAQRATHIAQRHAHWHRDGGGTANRVAALGGGRDLPDRPRTVDGGLEHRRIHRRAVARDACVGGGRDADRAEEAGRLHSRRDPRVCDLSQRRDKHSGEGGIHPRVQGNGRRGRRERHTEQLHDMGADRRRERADN